MVVKGWSWRCRWLAAIGVTGLLVAVWAAVHSPEVGRELTLRCVKVKQFSIIKGYWYAEMVLTNETGQLQSLRGWRGQLDGWGEVMGTEDTTPLSKPAEASGPMGIPAHGIIDFTLSLPAQTESWQV